MENKLTDDQMDAGCFGLACLGVGMLFGMVALAVMVIVVIARGGMPGC